MSEADASWRELFRSNDPNEVHNVAMTIAAMGFDLRCSDASGAFELTEEEPDGRPPYILQVPAEHVPELHPVLEDIVAEQNEFDEMLAQRDRQGRRMRQRLALIVLISAMIALALLGWLRM